MSHHTSSPTHAATATAVPIVPPRQAREKVLIVAHADGWIEAFAEHHVDVRLETMPYGCGSVEGELMAEEWFERQLSRPFRNIFCPGLRTTLGKPLSALPSDIAKREYDLALLRGIQQATKEGTR